MKIAVKTFVYFYFIIGVYYLAVAQPRLLNPDMTELTIIPNFNAAPGGQSLPQILTSNSTCSWAITPSSGTGFKMTLVSGSSFSSATQVAVVYRPLPGHSGNQAATATLTISNAEGTRMPPYNLIGNVILGLPQHEPVDVVMVIDVSGSMDDDADCEGAPSGYRKLQYLKDKLPALYQSMHGSFSVDPANRFGLVSFSSTASPVISLNPFNNISPSTFNTRVNSLSASGSTSMGAGLREAINMLGGTNRDDTRTRVIMLMTNGMQNTSPMVEEMSDRRLRIGAPANIILSGTDFVIIPYAIFTPSGDYIDLLSRLASLDGPLPGDLTTNARICPMTEALQDDWVAAAVPTGSPKKVAFKSGQLAGTTGTETFTVNENMDQLILAVSSAGAHNYTNIRVEKRTGGSFVDITSNGSISPPLSTPSKHRVWTLSFPNSTVGEYRFSFTANQPNLFYDASAVVDDRGLRQAFHVMPIVAAGEPMYLGAQLLQANTPVTDADVKAIIYAPKTRLNNNFSGKNVPPKFITTRGNFISNLKPDDRKPKDGYIKRISINHPTLPSFQMEGNNLSLGEKKYLVLLNETNFEKVFDREIIATVPLQHEGNGIYKAAFNGTEKSGLYHVRLEAKGTHPVIGAYERFEEKTPLVRFGTPDLKRSCLFVLYENPLILMIRPVDTESNLLGPNQRNAIKIQVRGEVSPTTSDYLDGRYTFYLNLRANKDPFITITIHDRLLYRGPLSKIPHKRWFFSIYGGATSPLAGDLETNYAGSWFSEARLGVRVYQQWGLQVKGGYYRFSNKLANLDDNELIGIGLGATYRQWFNQASGWYLNAEANLSAYQPLGQGWERGYNVGLGLQKPLNHFLNLSLDATFHRFGDNPINAYWTSALGLQWRFGHCHPKKSIFNLP